jgi:single-strand DNA-binding protein
VKFVDCSYWRNTAIQPFLKKGAVVEWYGSITARAWIGQQGEAQAALNCKVNNIIMHGGGKRDHDAPLSDEIKKSTEDLPFW